MGERGKGLPVGSIKAPTKRVRKTDVGIRRQQDREVITMEKLV